jgi:pyruvate,water dikinase
MPDTIKRHKERNLPHGEWNASLAGDFLWSNVNFGEAVAEVMPPLSWSVIELTLEEWTILPGYPPAGNIGGLPYQNLSIYASLFKAVGRSEGALLEALEGTAYTRLPEGMEIPLLPLSRWSLLSSLPRAVGLQMKQKRAVRELPAYLAINPAWCQGTRRRIQETGNGGELASLWRGEIELHVRRSVPAILGSASHAAAYTARLRRELTELVGPDDADALTSNLSDDAKLLDSLGPLVGLGRVARGEMAREAYLAQYGHRGPDEFELSAPRLAEDPGWLDRQLAQFRESPPDVESLLAGQRAEFEAARDRFRRRYPDKAKGMRRRLDEVAPRAQLREAARSEYARDRWLVRDLALRAGDLTGLGDGIFFLSVAEMLAALRGNEGASSAIPARQEIYERHRVLPPYPPIICGRFDPFEWASDPERRSDFAGSRAPNPSPAVDRDRRGPITGSPGSAGRVEGLVRTLERLEDGGELEQGEILVTAQTNVGWTFLFPRAAAVVTDVGAPLCHAAIVARELGVPAVVGCGNATMRLRTGDRVRVDGGRGVVEILDA